MGAPGVVLRCHSAACRIATFQGYFYSPFNSCPGCGLLAVQDPGSCNHPTELLAIQREREELAAERAALESIRSVSP